MLFSTSDTMAKFLVGSVPAVEIGWIRYSVFVVLAASPMLRDRRTSFRTRRPRLQVARGLGIVSSAIFFILSLGYLPIAEATALNFISPLLITLMAIPFLKEVVRWQGWIAIGVGFAGMLIVVRPGVGGLHPAAGLVLLSALSWCSAMIITRMMAGVERPVVTLFWTAVTGWTVLTLALPFSLARISPAHLALTLVVGVVASSGQFLAILAYRHAKPTTLAPITYAQLIWSAVLGYFTFGTVPDGWTVLGAVIIAASGFYVVGGERRRSEPGLPPALELPGQATGQQPADQPGRRAAHADQQQPGIDARQHHGDADAQHHAANQAAGDARRHAQPDDVAAVDHGRVGASRRVV